MLHEMTIASLSLDQDSKAPIIVLQTSDGEKFLPIWIGVLEASSIVFALQGMEFERPLTHDLFKNFLTRMSLRILKIEVCDLKKNTFFAKIYFSSGDDEFFLDARPSDAIAMAIRFNAPIYVDDSVLMKSVQGGDDSEMVDESDEGKKWAEYLEKLNPEDFGKFKV